MLIYSLCCTSAWCFSAGFYLRGEHMVSLSPCLNLFFCICLAMLLEFLPQFVWHQSQSSVALSAEGYPCPISSGCPQLGFTKAPWPTLCDAGSPWGLQVTSYPSPFIFSRISRLFHIPLALLEVSAWLLPELGRGAVPCTWKLMFCVDKGGLRCKLS